MLEGLKALFKSKKFWLTIIGSAVTGGMGFAGLPPEFVAMVASLFGINIGAQGLADMKKKP